MSSLGRGSNFLLALALVAALGLAGLELAGADSSSSAAGNSSSAHKSSSTTATQARQSPISVAASLVGALGSLVPGLITNVAPLVLLFGIGALMMPSLGMSAMGLLRESRRSANDQQPGLQLQGPGGPFGGQFGPVRPITGSPQDIYYFTKRSMPTGGGPGLMSSFNSAPLLELLERVARALDNADKRYN